MSPLSLRRNLLAAFVAVVLSSCSAISQFFNPPPGFQSAINVGANSVTDTNSSCTQNIADTKFELWTKTYSSGSPQTVNMYWYAPTGQTGYLYVYTGVIDSTFFQNPTTDAINSWYYTLSARVKAGHYLRLAPAEDTSNYSQDLVQMNYENEGYDYTAYATTNFGVVNGPGSINNDKVHGSTPDGSYIAGAMVMFHQPPIQRDGFFYNSTFMYLLSLHELGHVLGLDHNAEKGSIMYPGAAYASCYHYNDSPSLADTNQLESKYDPMINADEDTGGNPACRPGHTCPLVGPRNLAAAGQHFRLARGRGAYTQRPNVEAFMRRLSWLHGPSEGPLDLKRLSAQSLVASSTTAVQARFVRDAAVTRRGPLPMVVTHEFVVDGVLSDSGAAVGHPTTVPGQHMFVDEQMAYEDVPFSDDPPIVAGEHAVLFVRPVIGRHARAIGGHSVYQYTAPQISKWLQTSDGRVYLRGGADTRVARDINGRGLATIFGARGGRIVMSRADARESVLSDRHIVPAQNAAALRADPTAVLMEQASYDGALHRF